MRSLSKFVIGQSKVALVLSAWVLGGAAHSASADIYVICNPGLELSQADITEIYLGEKQAAGSKKLLPTDNASIEDSFVQKALKMNKSKYEAHWAKKAFREGINAPQTKPGDADVIAAVKDSPGGVGYVSQAPGPDVKVLGKY